MKYVEKSSTGTHSVGYEYDSINNLTALVETINGVERKTSYTYDGDNRPTAITAGNSILNYGYDDFGRVETLTTKHDGNPFATKTYSYKLDANGKPTNQVSTVTIQIGSNSTTYTYTYDKNGNITSISDGTYTTDYAYDSANQLIREENPEAETITVWTYDGAGNILTRTVYPYDTGTTGEGTQTNYHYTDTQWGDLLKSYDSRPIMCDGIGNPTNDFVWRYTWQHGRQLASMTKLDGSAQWSFTYNADGLRTQRTDAITGRTYNYTYLGSQLTHMTVDGHTMYFSYDASGTPLTMVYDGLKFYYITNLQGDVTAIVNGNGQEFVRYTYDAWGNVTATGSATNLRYYNPLRYRGYVYDAETELYYLQSRYYDPEMGRFINADNQLSTGSDLTGLNMFAYCGNNPVNRIDPTGEAWWHWAIGAAVVVACAAATVVTCGGFAAAAGAVAAVSCGVAAASTASTIAAAAFVGSATAYGVAVIAAASNSSSISDFNSQGNWGTVAATAWGGFAGAYDGYQMSKPQVPTSTPATTTGKGTQNPKVKAAIQKGQAMHKQMDYGPGVLKEQTIAPGCRVDGIDFNNHIIYELKPNNSRAIARGMSQLNRYTAAAKQQFGGDWTGVLKLYD